MTSQEWQRKPNFSPHETKELMRMMTEDFQFSLKLDTWKKNNQEGADTTESVEYLRYGQAPLPVQLRMCSCNSSRDSLQNSEEIVNTAIKRTEGIFKMLRWVNCDKRDQCMMKDRIVLLVVKWMSYIDALITHTKLIVWSLGSRLRYF